MQPSDQEIETVTSIPLIDSGNIKVPSLKRLASKQQQ